MFLPITYTYLFNLINILTNKKTPEKRGALERLSWRRDRLKWNPIYMTVAGCSPYKRAYKKAPQENKIMISFRFSCSITISCCLLYKS